MRSLTLVLAITVSVLAAQDTRPGREQAKWHLRRVEFHTPDGALRPVIARALGYRKIVRRVGPPRHGAIRQM